MVKEWTSSDFKHLLEESIKAQEKIDTSSRQFDVNLWIKKVWIFLSEHENLIHEVKTFKILLAEEDGKSLACLHVLNFNNILSEAYSLSPLPLAVKQVLKCCEVKQFQKVYFLPEQFMETFIEQPTVKGICRVLKHSPCRNETCINKINCLPESVRKQFAVFMGKGCTEDISNLKEYLRKLCLFPLSNAPDGVSGLHAVDDVAGIEPPNLKKFTVKYCHRLLDKNFEGINLAATLGCPNFDEGVLMTETLQKVKNGGMYSPQEVILFMNYFMNQLNNDIPEDQIELAAGIRFIENGLDEVNAPKDLFDPTVSDLRDLFIEEEKIYFPKERENWDLIVKWKKLKIKSANDVLVNDLINAVKCIQNSYPKMSNARLRKKVNAILCFAAKLPQDELKSFIEKVVETQWLPLMESKPDLYPESMRWKGENVRVCKPSEAYLKQFDFVGSVSYLTDCTDHELVKKLLKDPSPQLVLEQLKHLSETYKSSKSMEYNAYGMLDKIFKFLASQSLTAAHLDFLHRQEIIPTGSHFTKSMNVFINFLPDTCQISLEPHLFQLAKEWTLNQSKMRKFFVRIGCKETLTLEDLISLQEKIKDFHSATKKRSKDEIERDVHCLAQILDILKEKKDELSQEQCSRILFPIDTKDSRLILMFAHECTYSDEKHIELMEAEEEQDEEVAKIYFVHEKIRDSIAECFDVPTLSRRVMESGGIEDLEYEQWGQEEPLTTRIKNILNDYSDESLFKEMLQNADDAGAHCMKILYDERRNDDAKTGLIDAGMEECQGPALWVYNNAEFQEDDFKNIIKLGGGTKQSDHSKIGKFGLGFCSVYSVTDVPSILSGEYIVFFDPRAKHLGKAIKDKSKPGLKIPISKIARKFRKQFKPYHKIFMCDFTEKSSDKKYNGTLFRLPLRTKKQAENDPNGISTKSYNRQKVTSMISKFMESAGNLLLFTQNVRKIEMYFLEESDDPENCKCLFSMERQVEQEDSNIFDCLQKAANDGSTEFCHTFQYDIHSYLDQNNLNRLLGENLEVEKYTSSTSKCTWITTWAASDISSDRVQVGSTAMPLSFSLGKTETNSVPLGFYNTGHIFCFLPLPQRNGMLVHLNGNFFVEQNRKSIVSNITEPEKFDWNRALMSAVLAKAYLSMLENVGQYSESSNYYAAWPTSWKGNVFNPMVSEFYARICKDSFKVFLTDGQLQQKVSFKDCIFLDSTLQNDQKVGYTAYQCLLEFNPFQKTVLFMPDWMKKEFVNAKCIQFLEDQACSEEIFFTHVFLKKLAANFWDSDNRKEIRRCLLKRIFESGNENVLNEMKNIKCIPTKPEGTLRKPSEVVDEFSFNDMFCEADERFPEDGLLDVRKHLLRLGMRTNDLADDMLLERLRTIQQLSNVELAKRRCKALVGYIAKHDLSTEIQEKISNIPFLPVMEKPNDWPCSWLPSDGFQFAAPNTVYRSECKYLIGSVHKILDEPFLAEFIGEFVDKLKINNFSDVTGEYVVKQLQEIVSIGKGKKIIIDDQANNLKKICDDVYRYLDKSSISEELSNFCNLPCILVPCDVMSFKLVNPNCTSRCQDDDAPPYIYRIDQGTINYERFLQSIGVNRRIDKNLLMKILDDIHMEEGLEVENLHSVVKLYNLLGNFENVNPAKMLLPDIRGIMRRPENMCFEDGNDKITADHLIVAHGDLTFSVFRMFNVISKSAKLFTNYSVGVSFGQKEKLVTRLYNILEDYPCDISILNELLQNADDAKATQMHFIYDKRQHSKKGLFDDSMKCLQGPALVVYNDSCFSEKDIQGISNLGEGSKSSDPNQTGQFGIGFNAVYHITDVPSILSKGERTPKGGTLIIFDPHCKYVPGATQENPGIKVDDLLGVKENYPGVYNTYLQDKLPADTGTWFRFPLRTYDMAKVSNIRKDELIDEKRMMHILNSFQAEMSNSLLFLRNVRCIKLSEINVEGEISTRCEVKSILREQQPEAKDFSLKCEEELNLLRKGDIFLGEHPGFACNYLIDLEVLSDKGQWNEKWAVSSVFGSLNQTSVNDVIKNGYKQKKINLLPKAGIAACLSKTNHVVDNRHENVDILDENDDEIPAEKSQTMRAFCSLPLPLKTGLPVHMNGHFALDSNRTNVWTEDKTSVKGSWNEFILHEVLPFAYITSVHFLQEILFDDQSLCGESVEKYNSYFPVMKQIEDEIWKIVAREFYSKVLVGALAIFPMLFDEDTFELMKSRSYMALDSARIDGESSAVVFIAWRSQNDHFPAFFNGMKETSREKRDISADGLIAQRHVVKDIHITEEVSNLLKRLGLKLLQSSPDILESILTSASSPDILKSILSSVNGSCLPKTIEVLDILHFLKSWDSKHIDKCRVENLPKKIEKTLFKNVKSVSMLLSFCHENSKNAIELEGTPLCALEDGTLTYFSKQLPKFVSKYCHLFENSQSRFVSKGLVSVVNHLLEENNSCVKKLCVRQFAELLEQNISKSYRGEEPVIWKTKDISTQWMIDFWKCLSSTEGNVVEDCIQYLSDWCLVPVEDRKGREYLYPFRLAYAVLDTFMEWEDQNVLQVLLKIGFPKFANKKEPIRRKLSKHLFASELASANLLAMFCYHREMYSDRITIEAANRMLYYLLAKLDNQVQNQDEKTLNNFCRAYLFETLDGQVTDLPENKLVVCLKDEEDFPKCGLSALYQSHAIILLAKKDVLTHFDVNSMSQEDFYVDILLKHKECLDGTEVKKHMEHIRDKKLYKKQRSQEMKVLISKIAWIQNEVTGNLGRIGDFYSPNVKVCKLLCSKQDLLPLEFHTKEWMEFFAFIGLKTDVPYDLLLDFGRQIEGSCCIDEDVTQKSHILLEYIFKQKSTEVLERDAFMRQFRKIKCVVQFSLPGHHEEILSPPSRGLLVCFEGSVLSSTWEIMWSRCNIIPEKTVKKKDFDILGIKSKPDVVDVLGHIHRLCCLLQKQQCGDWYDLMKRVYGKLEEFINSSIYVEEELKQGLIETPFIYDESVNKFFHPYEVALLADSDKQIENFIQRGPEKYAVFNDMFRNLGVFDQPNFYHYLRLFHSLYKKISSKQMTTEEMQIAKKAFMGLLSCSVPDIPRLPVLVELYLPSESDKLFLSKDIVLCDRPSFKRRLPKKDPDVYVKTCGGDMKKLKKLPETFRPKILSELVTEDVQIGQECENDAVMSRLRRVFSSDAFVDGIWKFIRKLSIDVGEFKKESIQQRLHSVRIQKVSLLRTVLKDSNGPIDLTYADKDIYYKISKERILVYIKSTTLSFSKCFEIWKSKLCQVVCICARGLLSTDQYGFIQELLQSESDGQISEICKKYEIKIDSENWQPPLGTSIPLELHDLLDNTLCQFNEGEIVAFERIDPFADNDGNDDDIKVVESEFIYVRIIKEDKSSESEKFPIYLVFDGEDELSVSTIRLFRFCLLYTSPSPRDLSTSRMPSSA